MEVKGIGVLGPLVVAGADLPAARQQRLVLVALAAVAPKRLGSDVLIEGIWPDARPADPRKALQVLVARLRRALAATAVDVSRTNDGYGLETGGVGLDRAEFDRLCTDERALPTVALQERRRLLTEALGLWRGEPFGELGDQPLVADIANRLRLDRDEATGRLHEVRLALGELGGLLPELTAWAQARPVDEAAWCRLALGLHGNGRPTEALRTLHVHRRTVRETAGVEPSRAVAELEARLLADDVHSGAKGVGGNLRVPTRSFLGRAGDVRAVQRQLAAGAVTCLTGTGGIGKTMLAIQVAAGRRQHHRDGVWMCELADIEAGESIVDALAGTLGVHQQRGLTLIETLTSAYADADALIVLDNCEHVRASAAAVAAELLRRCPTITLLATSREPLGIAGERVHQVGPLVVPDHTGELGRRTTAVELFLERAREAGGVLEADDPTLASVAEICRRLDGVPLAIELAAARTRAMALTEMTTRLDERFRILVHTQTDRPLRQQTLWNAVDWSYQLLDPSDQELFRQLSVFLGGFTIEAAAAVSGRSEVDVEDSVWSLVDRSLLTAGTGTERTRYQMLETLRQFGQHRLLESGMAEQVRSAHLDYFVRLAELARDGIRGPDEQRHVGRVRDDLANLRAAHQHALSSDRIDLAAHVVTALHGYAEWRQFFELGTWAIATLARLASVDIHTPTLHAIAGWSRCIAGDFDAAIHHAHQGLEAEHHGGIECGWLHDVLAHSAYFQGDVEQGLEHGESELARARAHGDPYRLAYVLADSGTHAAIAGRIELAGARAAEALTLAAQIGSPSAISMAQLAQGFVLRADEPVAAIQWLQRAARLADTVDSAWTASVCRGELALLLALHGDPADALELGLAQFLGFRRAGDDLRARGVLRMAIPALHRKLPAEHWVDLVVLDVGTGDRPHMREPFNDRAVADVVARITGTIGPAMSRQAADRARAMDDTEVFDLGLHAMRRALGEVRGQ